MPESMSCLHMNHLNALIEGSEDSIASIAHFRDLYGAQFLLDLPEFQSCLILIGPVIFELFLPQDYLLNARFGPHYVGVEYQVPDTAEARKAAQARGIRLLGDIGVAFHTHPNDTFGVAVEIYHRNFHTQGPPNGYLEPIRPAKYWSDEHPLGITGLKRYSIVVSDVEAATHFFQDFMNATILYEAPRPDVGARAVGLALGDTVAELLTPTEDGVIQRYLARYGDGIRSTVFAVRDLKGALSYFADRGITLQPGDAPETAAIAPEDNCGLLFEFSE
jgi:catechol 2,3-dioxygenase-like lactoylglutathione lyase family enzyme